MEKIILSLKNIYMLLMTDDFPIYSESVIGRNERKGNTMLRFWQGQITEEYRCLPYGKMFWRNDGKRNRYTSYLCNRSAEIKTYSEYAKELSEQISMYTLLLQSDRFIDFLSARKYKHNILLRRIGEFMSMTLLEDAKVSEEIVNHIQQMLSWKTKGEEQRLFQAAYLLTVLMLYAAAGEAMDEPAMAVLRDRKYDIEKAWKAHAHSQEKEREVSYLTSHSGILQDNPLQVHRFFGREEELFNLKEMAFHGRKCLIQGIGGIGKTELLRQLIRICEDEKLVNKIALVSYSGSMAESFYCSFPEFQRQDLESCFHSVLYRLEQESKQNKVLLLVDNLTCDVKEDPDLLQLADLPCGILITTRQAKVPGFENYTLNDPSISTGSLIFRDNYGTSLTLEEQQILNQMLEDETFCHPLSLRLMARAAKSKGWTIQELHHYMVQNSMMSWQEGNRTVRLSQIYRQLYSYTDIPEECRYIAELFSLLPRDSYSKDFLQEWFPVIVDNASIENLEILTVGGWLDRDESGYSMHPFIAQCLRKKLITEKTIDMILCHIRDELQKMIPGTCHEPNDSELKQICGIVRYICEFMTGNISKEWFHAVVCALYIAENTPQIQAKTFPMLEKLEKHCIEQDDSTRISALILRCNWLTAKQEDYISELNHQKECRTISELLYLSLCLHAGYCAVFQHSNYSDAEKYLLEVVKGTSDPWQKITACFNLVHCCNRAGKSTEALHWAEEGNQLAHRYPECGEMDLCRLLSLTCQINCILQRKEAAQALLPELQSRYFATEDPQLQYHLLIGLEYYESDFGSPKKALEYSEATLQVIEQLRGKSLDYYVSLGSKALILKNLKRFEDALACFEEALVYYRSLAQGYWIQNLCHNAAVTCLDAKDPHKALTYLDEAYVHAAELGGYPLAACHRSYSKAYAQLGNREKEYHHLREAIPGLEAQLGTDNSNCIKARERLAELDAIVVK